MTLAELLKHLSDSATPGAWNPNPKRLTMTLDDGTKALGPVMSYMVGCSTSADGMKVSLGSERMADHKFVAALVNSYRSGELCVRPEAGEMIPAAKVEELLRKNPLIAMFLDQGFWHAKHVDLVIRYNGENKHYEADWIKNLWYLVPKRPKILQPLPPERT